jgi:cyclic pyranopterin phosphate synthase
MRKQYTSAREVCESFAEMKLPANFCHVPFASLIVEPDGKVGSCRMKGSEFALGNLHTQTLEEIWNGPELRQWRREFLSGDVETCKKEVRHQRCNTCPEYNSVLPSIELSEVQSKPPLRLALNLNGKCNLECRMCHIYQKPNGLYQANGWLTKVESWAESAAEIELLSGEPFIQKDTFELVERLAVKNPECLWSITTNGHWRLNETMRAMLDRIKFKHLIVSIDSLRPETYAEIRRGGTLKVVLENLDLLIEYDRDRVRRGLGSLNIQAAFLIQKDNWDELAAIHDFGIHKNIKVFRIFLYEPTEHSLLSLTEQEREEILDHYLASLSQKQLESSRRILLPLLESLPRVSRARYMLELSQRLSPAEVGLAGL